MPSTVVGLDIGRTAVRAVELKGGSKRPTVRRSGRVALPPGAVQGGTIKDADAVTDALRELWREARIGSRFVRLGLCSGSLLVRQLEVDWMPPDDLKRALRYQVADLLPVAVDDANLDHVLVGEHEATDPETGASKRMAQILLVATARGAVDEMVRCVKAAGLRPMIADLSPLALVRAAARASAALGEDPASSEVVIDVGADKVAIAVHTAGVPHFVRVMPGLGGESFVHSVMERTGLEWPEAEAVATDPATSTSGSRAEQEAVAIATGRLIGDIRTTLDYHAGAHPEHVPERVVLTGGGSGVAGFVELCARSLDLPVRFLDPAAFVAVPAPPDPAEAEARAAARRPKSKRGRRAAPEEAATPRPLLRPSPVAGGDLLVPLGLCLGSPA